MAKSFRKFLMLENVDSLLSQKISDVVAALQELQKDFKGLGVRKTIEELNGIIDNIRRILSGDWYEKKAIKQLQICGTTLAKALDSDGNQELESVITTVINKITQTLQELNQPLYSEEE